MMNQLTYRDGLWILTVTIAALATQIIMLIILARLFLLTKIYPDAD